MQAGAVEILAERPENPACLIMGMTIVVVSTIIEMPSSAVPSTIYMAVSAATSAYGLSWKLSTQDASARGMPV